MREVVFLSVETQARPVDGEIVSLLQADQALHAAAYRLERVRAFADAGRDGFLPQEAALLVDADACGQVRNFAACRDAIGQLITYVYGRVAGSGDSDCDIVLLTNGDPAANTLSLQVGKLLSAGISKLIAARLHLTLLQDQYTHNQRDTAMFMYWLKRSAAWQPTFYSSLNMLPWESLGEARQRTREAVVTMVRTIALSERNPLLLPDAGKQDGWLETVSVLRLDPPVEKVSRIVWNCLADRFSEDVLSHALYADALQVSKPKDFTERVRKLESFIRDTESRSLLPAYGDLLSMMPVRDPAAGMKAEDVKTPERAWQIIHEIYGEAQASRLYAQVNPSLDEMKARYQELGRQLTRELLIQTVETGQISVGTAFNAQQLLDQIGAQLVAQVEKRRNIAVGEMQFDHVLGFNTARKEAVRMAKLRHRCLTLVYASANQRLGDARRRYCADMARDAVKDAKIFLGDCLLRLESEFQRARAVRMSQPVPGASYNYRLEDAYRSWCEQSGIERVTARDLYGLFTEEIFRLPSEEAASQVCQGLAALLDERAGEAVAGIRANIDTFFAELDFRTAQLRRLGMQGDLSSKLLDFLAEQQGQCPLLYMDRADHPFRIRARALIFRTGSRESEQFAALVRSSGIEVIADAHEKGVLMVIKHAGDVLPLLLANLNNPESLLTNAAKGGDAE